MGESANTPSGDKGTKKFPVKNFISIPSEIGKLAEAVKEGLLPSPKLQNKDISAGDKLTIEQWRNPENKARILEATARFKDAPDGSDEKIKYKVIKDTLKRLLGVNIDAEIEEKSAKGSAEEKMMAALDAEAEGSFLDGMPVSELFIKKDSGKLYNKDAKK